MLAQVTFLPKNLLFLLLAFIFKKSNLHSYLLIDNRDIYQVSTNSTVLQLQNCWFTLLTFSVSFNIHFWNLKYDSLNIYILRMNDTRLLYPITCNGIQNILEETIQTGVLCCLCLHPRPVGTCFLVQKIYSLCTG